MPCHFCVYDSHLLLAEQKKKTLKEGRCWLVTLEVSLHVLLTPLLWTCDISEYSGRKMWERRLVDVRETANQDEKD